MKASATKASHEEQKDITSKISVQQDENILDIQPQVNREDYLEFAAAINRGEEEDYLDGYIKAHSDTIPSKQDALRLMLIAAVCEGDGWTVALIINNDRDDLPDDILTNPDSSGFSAISLALSKVQTTGVINQIFSYINYHQDNIRKVELDPFDLKVMSAGVHGGEFLNLDQTIETFLEPLYEGENLQQLIGHLKIYCQY